MGNGTAVEVVERGTGGEQRLWQAVIASTIEEWLHGPLRLQRQAEQYLFQNDGDFSEVCASAGMDAAHLRARLRKLCPRAEQMRGTAQTAVLAA